MAMVMSAPLSRSSLTTSTWPLFATAFNDGLQAGAEEASEPRESDDEPSSLHCVPANVEGLVLYPHTAMLCSRLFVDIQRGLSTEGTTAWSE